MFSSKTLNFNITWIKLSYSFIIELNPKVITFLDVTEVVTKISSTVVNNYSLQSVAKFVIHFWDSFFLWNGIVMDIQFLREFPSWVNFFILKFVVVKAHTLKMDNKVVRSFFQEVSLHNITLVVTWITLIVWDLFPCDEFSEWFFNIFVTLYFKRKRIKGLSSFFHSSTSWTSDLTARFSSKNILENFAERSTLEGCLHFVKENV